MEGLEAIRLRPAMYLGSTGSDGHRAMLLEVVDNSLDEYVRGFASRIQIDVDDGGWVTIEDDGRGIPVDPTQQNLSALELIFTRLNTPGRRLDEAPLQPHIHVRNMLSGGVGIAAVNAVCARMEVVSRRSGVAYRAAFECGRVVEPLARVGETASRGTAIHYQPDELIFDTDARLDLREVERRLTEIAWLCPKLDVIFQGRSLQRPEGLPGWVRKLAPDAIAETALSAIGTLEDVDVEVAFAWSRSRTSRLLRSFVNHEETTGGSHEVGLLAAIESAALQRRRPKEEVLTGLVAVVHVGMKYPQLDGRPGQRTLEEDEASRAVSEVVTRAIAAAPWWWDRLAECLK